jgi:integrase
MQPKQHMRVRFFLRKNKSTPGELAVIYMRISISGYTQEISLRQAAKPCDWDEQQGLVSPGRPHAKAINKKIMEAATDIDRHFNLCLVRYGRVLPDMVKRSYLAPSLAQKEKKEKVENLAFSEQIDEAVNSFIRLYNKMLTIEDRGSGMHPEQASLIERRKESLEKQVNALEEQALLIFDDKEWQKTFMLAVNEYLLHFMQLALAGHRSANTLEKLIGRKRRYEEFLEQRFKKKDIALDKLEYSFIEELFSWLLIDYGLTKNSAMKYAQWIKEITDRAVCKGWMVANIFKVFRCSYKDPDHDWLSMEELEYLSEMAFEKHKLAVIRDIFLFCSYTGLSYQEVYTLKAADIITGIDGKSWISKKRQKTNSDESLPLLPPAIVILDKYKDYPLNVRKCRLLPVPTNQEYNRCLKTIGKLAGIKIKLNTHKSRFFFANEIAYNNGVPLKTVSRMLGHKSIKTTEVYVRANKRTIAESMDMVEKKLFGNKPQAGDVSQKSPAEGARIIQMR